MEQCGKLFAECIEFIESETGMWAVRDLVNDVAWRNITFSAAMGSEPNRAMPWSEVLAEFGITGPKLEDMHTKAMFSGGGGHTILRTKGKSLLNTFNFIQCRNCQEGCGAILAHFELITSSELPAPDALSPRPLAEPLA